MPDEEEGPLVWHRIYGGVYSGKRSEHNKEAFCGLQQGRQVLLATDHFVVTRSSYGPLRIYIHEDLVESAPPWNDL